MRRGRPAFGLVVVLLVVAGAASGASISRAAVSTCGSLSAQTGPPVGGHGGGSVLTDVGFVSAGESWAVGDMYDPALHANRTLIERFDGSRWSVVPSANRSGMDNGLNSVSVASGAGWAVGDAAAAGGSAGAFQPLALHWDGAQWSLVSPRNFTGDALFTSVDTLADKSAWAVGFQTAAGGTRRTLIERASGGAWTQVASPNDGSTTSDNTLMAVSGTLATGLWAVGYRQSPAGPVPLVLRYDTSRPSPTWVSVSGAGGVPSPGTVETILTGVDVLTATDVWAVGYYDNGTVKQPLALHWDGSSWRSSRIPGAGMLRRVRAIAPGNVWSAGTY